MAGTASLAARRRRGEGLAALLAGAALLWLVTHVGPRPWPPPDEARIVLDEIHYVVEPKELRRLESFSIDHFSIGRDEAIALAAQEIEAHLDALFERAERNVPAFLDWYYSLSGEYSRAAMSVLALVDFAEPDYVGKRAVSMLLPEELVRAALEPLPAAVEARLDAHQERVRAAWLVEVSRRLESRRVPAPLAETADARTMLALDGLIADIVDGERSAFVSRQSVSGGAALGVGALTPVLARAAAAGGARAAGARTAARVATRAGAAAGRASAAAATGAAVCAPGGPAAALCAVLAGAGTWIASDWALLRLDEARNRDELERALAAGLSELRAAIGAELTAAYAVLVDEHYDTIEREIRRTFVPAQAGRSTGTGDGEDMTR